MGKKAHAKFIKDFRPIAIIPVLQKLYSKELDLDEDEVPLILHELNDSAIHFISKD